MIEIILLALGLWGFLDGLFEKWNIWDWIALKGSQSKIGLIYKLSQCRFCLNFHISIIITLILGVILSFSWGMLIVPVICSGIIHLMKK